VCDKPIVKTCNQAVTARKCVKYPDEVRKQRLPRAQLAFMHKIDHKDAEGVKSEWAKPFYKCVLVEVRY
jgi:hypothetical protein